MQHIIINGIMLDCVVSTAYSIVHCTKLKCRYNKHISDIALMADSPKRDQEIKINRTTAKMLAFAMHKIIKISPMAMYNEQRKLFIQMAQ